MVPTNVLKTARGEGQLHVPFTSESDLEALAFVNKFSAGENHFNTERKVRITPSKYQHITLKCCDNRFTSDQQFIFQALDWIGKVLLQAQFISLKEDSFKLMSLWDVFKINIR